MTKSEKLTTLLGVILLSFAAFFLVSLMVQFFDFGAQGAGHNTIFFGLGRMLYIVYGFSSFTIPIYLFIAAILLFMPKWTTRKGLYLAVSILPFYTLVATEKASKIIFSGDSGFLLSVKIGAALLIAALIISIEYLATGIVFDMMTDKNHKVKSKSSDSVGESENNVAFDNMKNEPVEAQDGLEENIDEQPSFDQFIDEQDDTIIEDPNESEFIDVDKDVETIEQSAIDERDLMDGIESDIVSDIEFPIDDSNETDLNIPDIESVDDIEDAPVRDPKATDISEPLNPQLKKEELDALLAPYPALEKPIDVVFSVPQLVVSDEEPFDEGETIENTEENLDEEECEIQESVVESDILIDEELLENEDIPTDEVQNTDSLYNDEEALFMEDPFVDEKVEDEKNDLDNIIPRAVPVRKRGEPYNIPTDFLTSYPDGEYWIIDKATQRSAAILKETLNEFKIQAEVTGIRKGPVITMFEILPAPGVKLNKIVALQDNIALRLAASSVRIVAPIPGKSAVGIEVPNKERAIVSFKELIETDLPAYKKMSIPVVLGKDITGEAQLLDLAKTPHLLIAGSTGSGKSVCVNSMILSILYKRSPSDVRMILIDPKVVELKLYNDIPHLLTPVITEPKKAFQALQYCLCEMERRYALLDGMGVREINSYNRRIIERDIATEKLPFIVVVIDEFADLMATTGKELESTVARLAAMSRAVGIHLVLATQRPSIDVITGLIKANIPSRIAFMVASKMDSRIIIDQVGAEKLLGKGDMLYASATDPFPVRIQGTFVSDSEVENVVEFVKQYGEPEYIDEEIFVDDEDDDDSGPSLYSEAGEDPLYDKALDIVVQAGKASASYIQRRLKIGYNRAARLVEEMEDRGIVGPANGSKPREIIHIP